MKPCINERVQDCVVLSSADSLYLTVGQIALWGGLAFLAYRILWKNNLADIVPGLAQMVRRKEWGALQRLTVALVFGVAFCVVVWLIYLRPVTASR